VVFCAFSANIGMGTNNMVAIEPPSVLTDNASLFAFYDRVHVDGRSFCYVSGEYETKFFDALIKANIVKVMDGLYDEKDILRCQAIFAAVFNSDFSEIFEGKIVDFADAEPQEFEQRLDEIDPEVRAGYYLQLKNYCAMIASAKLGCPIIGRHNVDLTIRQEILGYAQAGETARDAVLINPLDRSFEALKALLDMEAEDAPLSVNTRGAPAQAMSAINQEVAPGRWPEWYAEHRIDGIESARRLDAFLKFRRTPYFKAVQSYLLRAGTRKESLAQDWGDALQLDWAEMTVTPSTWLALN
jgi:hypothetical protein